MKKRLQGIVITRPPYGTETARHGLDMALAFAAFDQSVTLFFQGDGIWNLLASQSSDGIGLKQWTATLGELAQYDITDIIVCRDDMTSRALISDHLQIAVQILSREQIQEKIQTLEQIWVF